MIWWPDLLYMVIGIALYVGFIAMFDLWGNEFWAVVNVILLVFGGLFILTGLITWIGWWVIFGPILLFLGYVVLSGDSKP